MCVVITVLSHGLERCTQADEHKAAAVTAVKVLAAYTLDEQGTGAQVAPWREAPRRESLACHASSLLPPDCRVCARLR